MAGELVLIVEDDATLLRGLKDNFVARGYRVQTAMDGLAAVDAVDSEPPALVLLDIMLPRMHGHEVCRELRRRQLDMPIIFLTAQGQEDDVVRGLELGADDYVTKPFSIRELLARSNAFLRRRAAVVGDVCNFGNCRLHLRSHQLFRDGMEVLLTAKEYRLLAHLALRPGKAITRHEILDAVWGRAGVLVTTRSVDRCVTTLRAKIEPDPRHPKYLHTLRDVGYRFEP